MGPGLPTINRSLIGVNNNDEHDEALVKRQAKSDKNHDTPRNHALIPIGSTISVKGEDGGLCTHGTIVGQGDHNHIDRSYTTWIRKTGQLIIRNSKHVKPTWITVEQYLWDQLDKHTVTDPLEDILKQIVKLTPMNCTQRTI